MSAVLNFNLNFQAIAKLTLLSVEFQQRKNVQNITSHIAVFLPRGSFESPLWVPVGCEIPNMRPVSCIFHSPGKENSSEYLCYLVPYVIKISVALWLYHRFPLVQNMRH
jgi:hypothetical protein